MCRPGMNKTIVSTRYPGFRGGHQREWAGPRGGGCSNTAFMYGPLDALEGKNDRNEGRGAMHKEEIVVDVDCKASQERK